MWSKPGAKERPEAFHRVEVDFIMTVPIFIAGKFTFPMIDRLVRVTPFLERAVDFILVRANECSRGDERLDDRGDRVPLDVGQHLDANVSGALDDAKNGRLFFLQRAAASCPFQPISASFAAFFFTSSGCPLCPATT